MPQQGRFVTRDPFPGMLSQPATLNPYSYVVNNPIQLTDPSGEIAPILVITGIGFAAGAFLNAYQQTNGFSNFCHYDILQTLAWGVGGAAAAASFTIMAMSGVGLLGMGLQGAGLGLSGLGVSSSLSTSLFIAGTSTLGFSSTAMAWLLTSPSSIDKISHTLSQAATKAEDTVGFGSGLLHGTKVHSEFAKEVNSLNRNDLLTEVSFRNGKIQPYGSPGSIRVDVLFGTRENPFAVFDLKTGSASLDSARIQQIQSHLPSPNIPVIEIKP